MLTRNINDHTINDFLTKLSYEIWDTIFSTDDVNIMFNSFLDTYLKMFYSSFPLTLRSPTLYIYMEHLFLMFLDHTQRRSTVGRTPLDE